MPAHMRVGGTFRCLQIHEANELPIIYAIWNWAATEELNFEFPQPALTS